MSESIVRETRTVTVLHCTCQRCGHRWESQRPSPPQGCPACRMPHWERPAKFQRSPEDRAKRAQRAQ